MKRLYLDTAAGTEPNPSALHAPGRAAKAVLEQARQAVAAALSARPEEIVFTSGGTEGNNLAIGGLPAGPVIVSAIEHPSVLAPAAARAAAGRGPVLVAPVDVAGRVNLPALARLITPETVLVSVMYANNEIGAIQPVAEVAKAIRAARRRFGGARPYFHIDACQAPRFLPLNVNQLGADLLTVNSGKIYGPRGIGALFVRRGLPLSPLFRGGGQEAGRRAGTENHLLARDFAAALRLAGRLRDRESRQLAKLRDYFISRATKEIPGTRLNGGLKERLPNNINLSFDGILGEQVVIALDAKGIAASTGSACAIPEQTDSYVILALGRTPAEAAGAVRLTLPRGFTRQETVFALETLKKIISDLRRANHAYAADLAV